MEDLLLILMFWFLLVFLISCYSDFLLFWEISAASLPKVRMLKTVKSSPSIIVLFALVNGYVHPMF